MTRIDVQVVGTANVTGMVRDFAKVQAQVAGVNAQLEQMIALQNGVDPTGYRNMSRAAAQNDKIFRAALASTGMYEQQQVRINRATDDYIQKLKAQKLSFRDLMRERAIASRAYREQLAMENMAIRQSANANVRGRQALDVMYPKAVGRDMDTAGKRLAFFNEQLKSGAHQMVNWGKNTQWAGRQLMVGFTMPILAAGAAAGVMAYQIDKEFTRIQKVYDTTANANSTAISDQMAVERELMALREAGTATAIKSAREYGAAAQDTLNVQAELAATGLKGAELQKATTEVMRISRLGELEYQDALSATISLQTVFRMSTEELSDAFNYMNSVENATSLTTLDFAQAIPIASAPIKAFGGDVKELGILLTAMKSRGIEAVQGANAIKAAMQRLGRPSKQVAAEFQAITGADIQNLVDTSDSLTEIFQRIREETEDLSEPEKRDVFAGLFGSYQVSRMMALTEGVGDLGDATTQVGRAAQIAGQSTEAWAATAEREMGRLNESISGKFKNALEEVKIQMATMGEPFIELATVGLNGISALIDGFNGLPKVIKWIIAAGTGLAAIAGPAVMLAGLFANLFGNLLKGFTFITGLLVKMEILTTEQRAAKVATGLAESGFISERTAVQELTVALKAMTEAQAEANRMTANSQAASTARAAERNKQAGVVTNPAVFLGPTDVDVDNQKKMNAAAEDEGKTRKKTSGAMAGAAGSMALMAASSAVLMTTSEGTAHSIAQYALIGSMVLPAAAALAPLMKSVASSAKTAAIWNTISNLSLAKAGTGAKGIGAGFMSVGRGLVGMINPITAGLTLAALAGYAIYKAHKDAREEAAKYLKTQKLLNNSAEDYAQSIGASRREWHNISIITATERENNLMDKNIQYFNEDDEGKKISKEFKDMDTLERQRFAIQQYTTLIAEWGLSAKEAKMNVAALWHVGAGVDAVSALHMAETLVETYGRLKDFDWVSVINNQRDLYDQALRDAPNLNDDEFKELAATEGAAVGKEFYKAISTAENPEDAKKMFAGIEDAALRSWEDVRSLFASDPLTSDDWETFMNAEGLDDSKDLSQWFRRQGENAAGTLSDYFGQNANMIFEQLTKSNVIEGSIIKGYAGLAGLGDDINTIWELQNNWNMAAKLLSYKEAKAEVGEMMWQMNHATGLFDGLQGLGNNLANALYDGQDAMREMLKFVPDDELAQMEAALQAFAEAHNIKVGADAAETYYNIMNNVKNEVKDTTNAIKSMNSAWTMGQQEAQDLMKSAMEATQQDMADAIRDDFDKRMQSTLDARQAYWDRRMESQDAAFQNAQDALDDKWENKNDAAEDYWDHRIKRIQDAIDAESKAEEKRKAMFDAEMARISRMNEAMNRNIDFNAALNSGNFDEAAKIRNDASAKAGQNALERAAAAGSGASEARIAGLEGRLETAEEAREEYMKKLAKQEEAERKHLEKVQKMRADALRKEMEANMDALREKWEMQKENLDDQLELFLAYVPRNEKELRKHMKNVGLAYDGFGKQLMEKADVWAKEYGDRMKFHIREAGLQLQSDKMWKQMGKASVKEMLKGMGFKGGMKEFRHFISTGEMGGPGEPETRHQGGVVGDGTGSRYGVARTTRGLAPSERMVRAQKGEFIVNRKAAERNKELLTRLNSGSVYGSDDEGNIGGPGPGMYAAAMLTKGINKGTRTAMEKAYASRMATFYGHYGVPGTKKYDLPGVKPWVAEAANYLGNKFNIGTILGLGTRSNTSEHPLGRALDFMVSDDRGSALAEEVIKLHEPLDAMYVIWRQRINSFDGAGWRAMEDRGSATANHMDHVHVSFDPTGDIGDLPPLTTAAGFTQGMGGIHRPTLGGSVGSNGLHYNNAIDIGVGRGTPVYAVSDGVVSASYDIKGPLASDTYDGDGPYGSYGRVIKISHGAFDTLYAHLSQRFAQKGQVVKGGAKIGLSGSTGNSSGPHVHFEAHNANPYAFLKKGGTVKYDNTPALLHKNERVLTASLTSDLDHGITKFSQWANSLGKGKGYGKFRYPALGTGEVDSPYTFFDQTDPFNQAPAANPTNTAFGVRTGTYNLYRKSSNLRTQADLQRLMKMSDVLSLTEFIGAKRGLSDFITKQGWGIHAGSGSDDAAVIWNKAKIEFVEGAHRMLSDLNQSGALRDRKATYARLRDKESGREFWQIAAHTAGQAQGGGPVMKAQYAAINALVKELRGSGLPIFLAGDFNTRTNQGMPNFGLSEGSRRTGLQHVFSSLPGLSTSLLGNLSSDHPALLSMLNIPSLAKGGRVRWDNTIANLHQDEQVLTANHTKLLDIGLSRLANGAGNVYDVKVFASDGMDVETLANKVITKIERKEGRKPGSRRG